jgi:hypothetical protein
MPYRPDPEGELDRATGAGRDAGGPPDPATRAATVSESHAA